MNKQQAEGYYSYFRMVLGVTRKLVEQFPPDKMNFKPTPEQRTVAETVVHMYNFLLEATETIRDSKFNPVTEPRITDKKELLKYMDSQAGKMYEVFAGLTDVQLEAMIESYGQTLPGWQYLSFAYDEHWHHRGALTVYLRMCGVEPIMIYSYEK
jgi:uncharacterized damage-inducible protein DinB